MKKVTAVHLNLLIDFLSTHAVRTGNRRGKIKSTISMKERFNLASGFVHLHSLRPCAACLFRPHLGLFKRRSEWQTVNSSVRRASQSLVAVRFHFIGQNTMTTLCTHQTEEDRPTRRGSRRGRQRLLRRPRAQRRAQTAAATNSSSSTCSCSAPSSPPITSMSPHEGRRSKTVRVCMCVQFSRSPNPSLIRLSSFFNIRPQGSSSWG